MPLINIDKVDAPSKVKTQKEAAKHIITTPEDFLFRHMETFGTLTYKECYAVIELYLSHYYDYTFSPNKICNILQKAMIVNCKNEMRAIYDFDASLMGEDTFLNDGHGHYYRGMMPYDSLKADAIWPYIALDHLGFELAAVLDSDHNDTIQAVLQSPNGTYFSVCRLYPEKREDTQRKLDFFLNQDEDDENRKIPLFFTLGKTLDGLPNTTEYLLWDEYMPKYTAMPCILMSLNYSAKVGFQFVDEATEDQAEILNPERSAFWAIGIGLNEEA